MIDKNVNLDFFQDFTFEEFCLKYFPIFAMLVQEGNISKDAIKVIITKTLKLQTPTTKENLMKTIPKRDTDRKLVNWLVRAVELYRSKDEDADRI